MAIVGPCPLAVGSPHGSPVSFETSFAGKIPAELGQLKVIVEINLANNRLSGECDTTALVFTRRDIKRDAVGIQPPAASPRQKPPQLGENTTSGSVYKRSSPAVDNLNVVILSGRGVSYSSRRYLATVFNLFCLLAEPLTFSRKELAGAANWRSWLAISDPWLCSDAPQDLHPRLTSRQFGAFFVGSAVVFAASFLASVV